MRRPWLAALLAVGACTARESPRTPAVRDSAGVAIVENGVPAWRNGDEWNVGENPLVEIGAIDGAPEYQFQSIQSVLVTAAGEIAIADWGAREIRFYDGEGRPVRSHGRRGEGPGEFELIVWLGGYLGDSLLLYDLRRRRISVLGPDGSFGRELPAASRFPHERPVGHFPDGAIVRTVTTGQNPAELPGMMREIRHVLRLLPDGSREDTLLSVPSAERMMYRSGQMATIAPRPFGAAAHFAMDDSLLYVGIGEEYRIDVYDRDGRLVRSIRRPQQRRRVMPDDIARHRAHRQPPPASVEGGVDQRDQIPFPESMPSHGPILTDAAGHLWVQEYAANHEDQRLWSVFDSHGQFLGQVRTPVAESVQWIGDRRLATVWRDDLDVPYVRLYELTRTGTVSERERAR